LTVARLEDWAIEVDDDPAYLPPEQRSRSIVGVVYGHPRKTDGERVRTSPIVNVDGRRVQTRSGSVYHLGEINRRYLSWMREKGFVFSADDPVRGWK
jgi:hypothetical protein